MRRVLLWVETCRLWVLLVTVPQTLMWSSVSGSGGWWMIVGHASLVLLYLISLDLTYLRVGSDPRLSYERDRFRHDMPIAESARVVLLVLIGLTSLSSLFVELWLAILMLIITALIVLRFRALSNSTGEFRLRLVEILLPAAMILLPALLIGSWEWGTELEATRGQRVARTAAEPGADVMSGSMVGSAFLVTLMLSAFVLLCQLRDETIDRTDGLRTTVTHLGREFSMLYAFGLLAACLVLGAFGIGARWWGPGGWRIGAVAALATMFVVWLLANRQEARAAGVWIIATVLVSVLSAGGVLAVPEPLAPDAPLEAPQITPSDDGAPAPVTADDLSPAEPEPTAPDDSAAPQGPTLESEPDAPADTEPS